jgi:hypothetical protein
MKRSIALPTLALSFLMTGTSHAGDKATYNRRTGLMEPSLASLRRAAERGDRADLGRWAERIGPARLARALAEDDRDLVLAVLDGVAALPSRLLLVEAVLPLCDSPDEGISERATRTVGQLLNDADPARVQEWEVPGELVRRSCQKLAQTAARASSIDLRLTALQSLNDGAVLCLSKVDLSGLVRDQSPEIRRAALLTMRPREAAGLAAVRQAERDADPSVAAAAGASLCRAHVTGPRPAGERPLRDLLLTPGTPVEDAAEIMTCLAGSTDPADSKTLQDLASSTSPLRELAKRTVDKR